MVYQALPSETVPDRNDKLIFEEIGPNFVINMLIQTIWLFLFPLNTAYGFVLSFIDIVLLLGQNIYMMMKTSETSVNLTEFISLRVMMTIYAGWIGAATILNATYMLKSLGFSKIEDFGSLLIDLSEE